MVIKFFEKYYGFSLFITLIGACLIFWISTLNFGGTYAAGKSWVSVAYHFFAFFCFGFFVFISIVRGIKKFILFFTGLIFSFGYAIFDEIHQYFVPWRFCDLLDAYIDTLGIVSAMMIYLVIVFWRD